MLAFRWADLRIFPWLRIEVMPGHRQVALVPDLPNIFPEPASTTFGVTGPLNTTRRHAAINAYTLAFFDQYLKSEHHPLLPGPSARFPGVGFDKR